MEVRDQSKISQVKDQYREAQQELKGSYDKNLKQMKEGFEAKIDKQAKNYAEHKTKLEEENQINNEFYTDKTRSAIDRGQEEFKSKLRENSSKFEQEKSGSKAEFDEKLSSLSDSYKKSLNENNRYQSEIKKSLNDRYSNASKKSQDEFNTKVDDMSSKFRSEHAENIENSRQDRFGLLQKHSDELEEMRTGSNADKFKDINRLKNDNENLRTTLGRDNQMLKDRQEERVAELLKLKGQESDDGMKNFSNLQESIRQSNINDQDKQNQAHANERKNLETKFNEDVRNIQKIAAQKIRGGTSADSVHDELKKTKSSYENRLQSAREEIAKNNEANTEKIDVVDIGYREKLKEMKTANVENLARKESEANETLKQTVNINREKNSALVDRYKNENGAIKKEADDRLAQSGDESKNKIKAQRVEFGRVVNTINDKNMETINSLKDDFSKDKSTSIEKSKKEFNEEKVTIKNDFNRQNALKDSLYEQKLAELEKQTGKIINNYENRISQIVRKAETEVDSIKSKEETRVLKESQANKLAFESLEQEKRMESIQTRDKYEGIIAKNQALSEQKTSGLVRNYEDKLAKERTDHQKELAVRLGEARSQFERLYKSSELEKETMRVQYEQRMENVKLASSSQDNSKKA